MRLFQLYCRFPPYWRVVNQQELKRKLGHLSYCMVKNGIYCTPPPMTHYIRCRKFFVFKRLNGVQRNCQPTLFLLSCLQLVKYLYLKIQMFGPTGSYPLLGVDKGLKMRSKLSKISKSSRSAQVA